MQFLRSDVVRNCVIGQAFKKNTLKFHVGTGHHSTRYVSKAYFFSHHFRIARKIITAAISEYFFLRQIYFEPWQFLWKICF